MDITVQAFELTTGNGITLEMLGEHMKVSSADPVDGRLLYIDRADGWWRGLLLTARNIKAFSRMKRDGGVIRLSPEAITEGELAHFNFFLLNEKKRRGLYQYYHGAASIHGYANILKKHYSRYKNQLISEDCQTEGENPEHPPTKIKKKYSGSLNYQLVLRRQSFEDLVRNLQAIKNITIEFVEYKPNQKTFRTLANKAKIIKHRLTFMNKYDDSIRNAIIKLVASDALKNLSGVGVEESGLERNFRLLQEPESLGKFDFNDIVLETEFDSRDVRGSLQAAPLLSRLKEIADNDAWMTGRI